MPNSSSTMRGKIMLQKRVLTPDAYGESVVSWEDVTELCCSMEPLVGREFFKSGDLPQRIAEIDSRIRIRYRKGLNPAENRIVYDGIKYDLVAVIADRPRRQTQLMVKASAVQQDDGSTINV